MREAREKCGVNAISYICLIASAVCILSNVSETVAAIYYVSNKGDDSADGVSPWTPFRTLSRATMSARDGDTVLLRRGDIFREFANFEGRQVMLASYGPDQLPMPVISGSIVLKDWQPYCPRPSAHEELMEKLNGLFVPNQKTLAVCGLNVQAGSGPMKGWSKNKTSIFVTSAGDQKVENLFVDGKIMWIARYPNGGQGAASWLRIDDGTNNNTIVDADLAKHPRNAADYWKGATVRWRRWSWYFENRPVASYDASGKITLGDKSLGVVAQTAPGWGYYIDGKLEELDAPGEWFFDPNEKKVYLWAPNGDDPNKLLVEGACIASGSAGGGASGVEFRHQTKTGMSGSSATGCKFVGIGDTAIKCGGGGKVTNCIFEDLLNTAMWCGGSGGEIANNTFLRIGTVPGYGGCGVWHACGIIAKGRDFKIHHNYFEDVGYAGILLGTEGCFAEYNIIKHAMATLNDGGAIYTDCSKCTIRNNIVLDTEGNLESSGPWACLGQGIWPEFLGDYKDQVIENNTVANSGCNGLFLENDYDSTIAGNVFYNNKTQIFLSSEENNERTGRHGKKPSNHKINNNIFFSCTDKQATLDFRPEFDYGSLKGNYYCSAVSEPGVSVRGTGNGKWNANKLGLKEWMSKYSWADKEPKVPGIPGMGYLFINDTIETKDFPLPRYQWADLDGKAVGNTIKLEPYTSKILILCGASGAQAPKYYLYSELKKAEIAAAKPAPASRPAAAVAEAQPEYKPKPVVTEKLATMEDWVAKLKFRLGLYLKSGQKPTFRCSASDSKVTLDSMDDSGQLALTDRDGKKSTLAWEKLTLDDYINISQEMAGMTDSALDHALAAYFYHTAKKTEKAQEHLKKAGSYEKAVKDATGL